MNVKTKIYVLTLLAALLPSLVMIALLLRFRGLVADEAERELTALARLNVTASVRTAYGQCETANSLLQDQANQIKALRSFIAYKVDVIAFSPPLVITEAEIDTLLASTSLALDDTLAMARERGLVG